MIIHSKGDKVNFVDGNNVLVGFDMGQSCCEHARWWINRTGREGDAETPESQLADYFFDPNTLRGGESPAGEPDDMDAGGSVAFRLVSEHGPELWLTLANSHNGYYSHGFNVDVGGKTIWDSSL